MCLTSRIVSETQMLATAYERGEVERSLGESSTCGSTSLLAPEAWRVAWTARRSAAAIRRQLPRLRQAGAWEAVEP